MAPRKKSSSKRSTSSSKRSTSSSKRSGNKRSASSRRNGGPSQEETDRYRQAAEDALQQLDWAIGYLHGIRKTGISKALARNRSFIRRRLMQEPEEPLPTEQTGET
jgi:hypothetical protein